VIEYDKLMLAMNESETVEAEKEKATLIDVVDVLRKKVNPDGLHIEIAGTWLWVSGKTYGVRDVLKSIGFRYSSQKQSWYFRNEINRSFNQTPLPMDQIRELYGSKEVALR
jgi:hypothetical protein